MKHIADYAKEKLGLAARVGKPSGYGGVADHIEEPQFATALGLMLIDSQNGGQAPKTDKGNHKITIKQASGVISQFLGKFKA